MNRLPIVILSLALTLVAIVTGCSGAHRYDSRLVAADSLMQANPDSALAIIEDVNPDSLTTPGDRAYRDLLRTQARYKCYADITTGDDSAATRAISYYKQHSREREKLTRAYLYKGAVMEELGHPDSAMFYYKTAEAKADDKDYINLGQINTRIASLYRWYYADMQICYNKYAEALKYYNLTGNKRLQLDCILNMGACSGITRIGHPEELLMKASELASELKDSLNYYKSQELLCRQLLYNDTSIIRAKQIAMNCLHNYRRYVNNNLLLDLADIYSSSKMPDSARYYLGFVRENANQRNYGQVLTRKNMIMSRITRLEGDTSLSNHYDRLAHQASDSLFNNKQKFVIQQAENDGNTIRAEQRQQTINSLHKYLLSLLALTIVSLLFFALFHLRRMHRTKAIINELQHANINKHESLLEQIDEKDGVIGRFIKNLVEFMQQTIETTEKDSPSVIRKHIKEFISEITDNDFWNELQAHIDRKHNNLISNIALNRRITPSDLHFIALSCCGFDYVEIAIVLDYTPKYISQKRKEIARKLHLRIPLQEYLNNAMKQ